MSADTLVSGRQLRAARVLALLSQEELGRAAGISGRSIRTFERVEAGRIPCAAATLVRLVAALSGRGVEVFSMPAPGARLSSPQDDVTS